ncbi:MAG: hypothetical protein J4N76_09515 [Chloroflexi bacterium]|nr:hypothetical protein [Chloroflexota bacterium]MDK1046068.1 hypothetical protein [Anaerolineales bacterium]MCH8876936.1 hypothetical protein [Chloroflexota bacterium]MCI0773751.1 hypothetical protein [Chloroflexota bacterium]MCI0806878.1 hypothetical protein [Chloroflexota bacterium]
MNSVQRDVICVWADKHLKLAVASSLSIGGDDLLIGVSGIPLTNPTPSFISGFNADSVIRPSVRTTNGPNNMGHGKLPTAALENSIRLLESGV